MNATFPGGGEVYLFGNSALSISPVVAVVFAVWLGVMISVPLVSARGGVHRGRAISSGVVAQSVLIMTTLLTEWHWTTAVTAIVTVPVLGWLAEFIGSRTGIPFGRYHYTELLQPQLHRVPVAIPFAWLMMLPPSWAVAHAIVPEGSRLLIAVISGFAFTAWDLYLDPHLVRWRFWEWDEEGSYLGIPLKNFGGWFLWATAITYIIGPPAAAWFPLVVVYGITWLFQFGGHLVFWKWPLSGIVGFIAMGLVAVPALFRSLVSL